MRFRSVVFRVVLVFFVIVLWRDFSFLAFAADYTATGFILRDPVLSGGGGYGTTSSHQLWNALSQPAVGTSTATGYELRGGFLYFPTPSSSATPTPTPSTGGDSGGIASAPRAAAVVLRPSPSPAVTPAIPPGRKPFLARLPEILKPFIPPFLRPKPEKAAPREIPVEEVVPREAPLALRGAWRLLPREPLRTFALAPLPRDLRLLAEKFPKLRDVFVRAGIAKITDVGKLRGATLHLPGLSEAAGLPPLVLRRGALQLPHGIPLASLPREAKERIPSEVMFARAGDEKIDLASALTVSAEGKARQSITTVAGKPLSLIVKPEGRAKAVKGYVVFRAKKPRPLSFAVPFSSLTASLLFARPAFAEVQERPVPVDEELVLFAFEYVDEDGDGIYTADIQSPVADGEYEIITVIEYEDPERGTRQMRLTAVVDPEGYVYERVGNQELRIRGARVALYMLDRRTGEYVVWPGGDYAQDNPQTTDVTGKYSFLVPEGTYYLEVMASGYRVFRGEPFEVKAGTGVHDDVELKPRFLALRAVDWEAALLFFFVVLLLFHLYRSKKASRGA